MPEVAGGEPPRRHGRRLLLSHAVARSLILVVFAASTACSDGSTNQTFSVLTTTPVLAALAQAVTGVVVPVRSVMPASADPHDYMPSAQDRRRMLEAGLLVVNGGGLEEGLLDVVDQARRDGVPTLVALDTVTQLRYPDGSADPHFWLDPQRAATFTQVLADRLSRADPAHAATYRRNAARAVSDLERLGQQVEEVLAPLPAANRVLVVSHDAFRYFAARFGLRVLGSIVPGRSTQAAPSAAHLADLAALMRAEHICAVFSEATGSDAWARSLASAVGSGTQVVALYDATLPDGSYPQLLRTDATRIAAALGACQVSR